MIPLSYTEALALQDELKLIGRKSRSPEVRAAARRLDEWIEKAIERRKAEVGSCLVDE